MTTLDIKPPPSEAQLLACWCVYIEKTIASARPIGRALCLRAVGCAAAARHQRKAALIPNEAGTNEQRRVCFRVAPTHMTGELCAACYITFRAALA